MSLTVKTIINNPVSSNCHIIYDSLKKKGLVIDPGSEDSRELIDFINHNNINVDYVILTHEHFDHIWSADKLSIPVLCSYECRENIQDNKLNLSLFFNQVGFELNVQVQCIEDFGCKLEWNNHTIHFYKNRAHSPGGIMFIIDRYIVTGDLLIKDLKTVTKLKWAQKNDLPDAVRWLENSKGNNLTVLAGHGDSFCLDDYDLNKIY